MPFALRAGCAATVLLLGAQAAQAVEAFAAYDNFSSGSVNPALWTNSERVLTVKRGALNVMQRQWGQAGSDSGLSFSSFSQSVSNPAAVTELKAKVTVNALEVNACASNSSVAQSRARIVGSFFNIGTPVPGSQVGDALAQVRLTRFSNSTDPEGVLRVQGLLSICTNADCSTTNGLGTVDMGTVNVGTPTTVQMQWDQAGKSFLFARDNGAFSGSLPYSVTDTSAPGAAFKQLSTRLDLPNCLSGARVAGSVDAMFDNVAVNKSAAP